MATPLPVMHKYGFMHIRLTINNVFIALLAVLLIVPQVGADEIQASTPEEKQKPAAPVQKKKERPWVLAPIVVNNPAFGFGLGLTGMYFFQLDESDTVSPPSRLFGTMMYSDTDSYFMALVPTFHLKEDQHRVEVKAAYGKVNNEFDDFVGGTARFATTFYGINPSYRYLIGRDTYVGGQFDWRDIGYSAKDQSSQDYLDRLEAEDTVVSGVGLLLTRDTRDNQLYPFFGSYTEASYLTYLDALGSDEEYDVLDLQFNNYQQYRPGHIIAWRLSGRFTSEDTPYSGQSTLGRGSDLRGYTGGERVAENLIAAQAEYRWRVWRKWGVVGFIGYSALYDGDIKDIESDNLYGSYGLGIRYALLEEQRVNLRLDVAKGDGDDAIYISIREAF
jgi:outer membrane protein assembly factor BamA